MSDAQRINALIDVVAAELVGVRVDLRELRAYITERFDEQAKTLDTIMRHFGITEEES